MNSIHILVGSLPIKIKNRSFLIDPNGNVMFKYNKIHIFDVNLPNNEIYAESKTYSPDSKAVIAQIKLKSL